MGGVQKALGRCRSPVAMRLDRFLQHPWQVPFVQHLHLFAISDRVRARARECAAARAREDACDDATHAASSLMHSTAWDESAASPCMCVAGWVGGRGRVGAACMCACMRTTVHVCARMCARCREHARRHTCRGTRCTRRHTCRGTRRRVYTQHAHVLTCTDCRWISTLKSSSSTSAQDSRATETCTRMRVRTRARTHACMQTLHRTCMCASGRVHERARARACMCTSTWHRCMSWMWTAGEPAASISESAIICPQKRLYYPQ